MKTKLLRKLRKKAKKKILLYQMSERVYKITSPYSYQKDTFISGNLDLIKKEVLEKREEYILTCVERLRKEKEKQNYPKLINF